MDMTLGQELSWIFGGISNGLWLFVFIPQLYKNYKSKNGNALSLLLLFCLILGDIFSVLSAVAKGLNVVIIYSALYHIVLDVIVISQIMYYRITKNPSQTDNINEEVIDDDTQPLLEQEYQEDEEIYQYMYLSLGELLFLIFSIIFSVVASILLALLPNKDIVIFMADVLGWLATMIFITARLPQILLNYQRKSTKGLSLLSFIIINIANWCFLLSILILLYDIPESEYLNFIKYNLQWIVGSGSTSLFDAVIFYQFYDYRPRQIFLSDN
jgi:uncharacterized protein with PQ loop repeat